MTTIRLHSALGLRHAAGSASFSTESDSKVSRDRSFRVAPFTCVALEPESFNTLKKSSPKKSIRDGIDSHEMVSSNSICGRSKLCESSRCRESKFLARYAVDALEMDSLTATPSGMDPQTNECGTSSRRGDAFFAQSESGRVVCNSKGCTPATDSDSATYQPGAPSEAKLSFPDHCERSYHSRHGIPSSKNAGHTLVAQEFAEFLDDVWMDSALAEKYYETALKRAPFDSKLLISFAKFTWRTQRSFSKADELFNRALKESSDDEALASYALFLWESNS